MTAFQRLLQISEDAVLRRLRGCPGAFFLRDEDRVFVGAFPDRSSFEMVPRDVALQRTGRSRSAFPKLPEWVGILPYEHFRGIERGAVVASDRREPAMVSRPRWQHYSAVGELTPDGVVICADEPEAGNRLARGLQAEPQGALDLPELRWLGTRERDDLHRDRIRAALEEIERGNLYQVNLARRFEFASQGDPIGLLRALGPLADAPFAAAMNLGEVGIVSTSPELFLDVDPAGRVRTRPIKGTRPRSPDPHEDLRLRIELDESEKERAELAMVIDIERNDLGRLALAGSVRLRSAPHVVSHPTVHHRAAEVEAVLRPEIGLSELLWGTMPSGSVTGAPKPNAMGLIARLEAERRGLYTGALGYSTSNGSLRLSMAIRVLCMSQGRAHYFAGGGIVADSDPDQEIEETLWKAEQLRALVRF